MFYGRFVKSSVTWLVKRAIQIHFDLIFLLSVLFVESTPPRVRVSSPSRILVLHVTLELQQLHDDALVRVLMGKHFLVVWDLPQLTAQRREGCGRKGGGGDLYIHISGYSSFLSIEHSMYVILDSRLFYLNVHCCFPQQCQL